MFLGLLRPALFDSRNVRAWVAPSGIILCTDPQFASLTGVLGEDMVSHVPIPPIINSCLRITPFLTPNGTFLSQVGRNFRTLCTDIAAADVLLETCRTVPYERLVAGEIMFTLELAHK